MRLIPTAILNLSLLLPALVQARAAPVLGPAAALAPAPASSPVPAPVLAPVLAPEQVVHKLERSTARLARTHLPGLVPAIQSWRLAVYLRPEAALIIAARWCERRGFQLGADGTLAAPDRAALQRLIEKHAPEATPGSTMRRVLGGLRELRAADRRLRGQDPLIDDLLRRSAGLTGGEVVVWRGRRGATLTYRPESSMLVGCSGTAEHGFLAEGGKLAPGSRDGLRAFLERNGE